MSQLTWNRGRGHSSVTFDPELVECLIVHHSGGTLVELSGYVRTSESSDNAGTAGWLTDLPIFECVSQVREECPGHPVKLWMDSETILSTMGRVDDFRAWLLGE